jgi:hypothetical protein
MFKGVSLCIRQPRTTDEKRHHRQRQKQVTRWKFRWSPTSESIPTHVTSFLTYFLRIPADKPSSGCQERFKTQQKQEPDLWVPLEYRSSHRPDALFRYRQSQEPDALEVICAVEAECSAKKYEAWSRIWTVLQSHYTFTHYYVHPDIKASFCKAADRFAEQEARFSGKTERQWLFIHELEEQL